MANVQVKAFSETAASELEERIAEIRAWLLPYCTGLTGCKDDGEDIVQEVLIRAFPIVRGQLNHPNVKAYLLKTAKHVWIDIVRKRDRQDAYVNEQIMDAQSDVKSVDLADAVMTKLAVESAVKSVIASLSPLQRTVFLLRDVLGYTGPEVGRTLCMSEDAVKSVLHRARGKVKEIRNQQMLCTNANHSTDVQTEIFHAYLGAIRDGDISSVVTLMQLQTSSPLDATVRVLAIADRKSRTLNTKQNHYSCDAWAILNAA